MLPPQILTTLPAFAIETLVSLYNGFLSLPLPQPQVEPEADPTLSVSGVVAACTLPVSELHGWFGQEACMC